MTATLLAAPSARQFFDNIVLTFAAAFMFVLMGMPTDGMYTFLSGHGLIGGLERPYYYLFAGGNSVLWLCPAMVAVEWCIGKKMTFLDWPIWAKCFVGFGFASTWGGVLFTAQHIVFA